jgi:rhodanese-related sulfurtransferase
VGRTVTPQELRRMLDDGQELALLDVREELTFSEGHLLFARCVPLSRLELKIGQLVPRRAVRMVLCDGGDGLAARAAPVLAGFGYDDVSILAGGVAAWKAAGFELFSGVNVPSKAFGEFVEHASGTPSISADELSDLMRSGVDMVVVDSRPFDEYSRVSIPTGINIPGAELVLRIRDVAPAPETLVVVNCAGRTRSIIGAQSLINAGVPNRVVALRNGAMGWSLAGRECETGKGRLPPPVTASGLAWAESAARKVAKHVGVRFIDLATLAEFRDEASTCSLYLFDVRDPAEYEAGHLPGAVSAPGGQLVQATDQYIGTLGSRVVLVDDKGVRAVMTASWLIQMGWRDVFVLQASGDEKGWPSAEILGLEPSPHLAIDTPALARLIADEAATIIDLSLSRNYQREHIGGAWFAIRAELAQALSQIPLRGTLVLTSEDGSLAGLAAPEAARCVDLSVRYLPGGNAAWRRAGHSLTAADPRWASEPRDVWLKPYERSGDPTEAMAAYLAWETDLLPRIARDGSTRFRSGVERR